LIVESNQVRAFLLTSLLAQETTHHAVVVSTGQQALKVLTTIIPDLLIFSQHLADMRGMALYEQIQTVEKLKPLPLMMLGAHTTMHGSRFIRLGTPFDRDAFLHAVEALLSYTTL